MMFGLMAALILGARRTQPTREERLLAYARRKWAGN